MELALAVARVEAKISELEIMIEKTNNRIERNNLVIWLAQLDQDLAELRTMAI
jgi:hypothetical protein